MMVHPKRQSERYPKEIGVSFDFLYDATTKLKYQVDEESRVKKYVGVSKNISASGLCLSSKHKLEKGQNLHLEVYLPEGDQPIHMEGEVCWCESTKSAQRELFEAGIRLKVVEGQAVDATVHLDETHHVIWSNVLEAIFGTFRKLIEEKKGISKDIKTT